MTHLGAPKRACRRLSSPIRPRRYFPRIHNLFGSTCRYRQQRAVVESVGQRKGKRKVASHVLLPRCCIVTLPRALTFSCAIAQSFIFVLVYCVCCGCINHQRHHAHLQQDQEEKATATTTIAPRSPR